MKLPAPVRRAVIERASGRCEYCLSPSAFTGGPFGIEHVHPRSRGGTDTLENLAFACGWCNGAKYNKTKAADPETGESVPLYNPRTDRWPDHFRWSEDSLEVQGVSPTGRASVASLEFNRPESHNLRVLLRLVGLHPPPETEP